MLQIKKLLNWLTKKLNKVTDASQLEAEILLSRALNKSKTYLHTHADKKVFLHKILKVIKLYWLRTRGYAIAHIIGEKEFYKRKFIVNTHTLIPRPESELFIHRLEHIQPKDQTIVDVGTGSGCLIVTAAVEFPNNNFAATDNSTQALKVAAQNAKRYDVHIDFKHTHLIQALMRTQIDILLANLPYLTPHQLTHKSLLREPIKALLGGENGLNYYYELIQQIQYLDSQPKYILIEIDPAQKDKLIKHIKKNLPAYQVDIFQDLSAQARLIQLSR